MRRLCTSVLEVAIGRSVEFEDDCGIGLYVSDECFSSWSENASCDCRQISRPCQHVVCVTSAVREAN